MGVFGQKNWTGDTAVPLITLVINRLQFKDGSMSSESRVREAYVQSRTRTCSVAPHTAGKCNIVDKPYVCDLT